MGLQSDAGHPSRRPSSHAIDMQSRGVAASACEKPGGLFQGRSQAAMYAPGQPSKLHCLVLFMQRASELKAYIISRVHQAGVLHRSQSEAERM